MPGYVVDSRTTSAPGLSCSPAAVSVAARRRIRSGPSDSDSGVGTQITVTPAAADDGGHVGDGAESPGDHPGDSASDRSSTWERPAFSPSTVALPDVEAGDAQAASTRLLGERQADVTKAYDHHVHLDGLLAGGDHPRSRGTARPLPLAG